MQNYFREKFEQIRNKALLQELDNELENQYKLLKNVNKDLDEFEYNMQRKEFDNTVSHAKNRSHEEYDPEIPDNYYVKSSKTKHFAKNIAIWKKQEIYEDLHANYEQYKKKFRILSK